MEIILKLNKSVEQNAEAYYDKAKKFKKKIPGIKKTIENYEDKIKKFEKALIEYDSNIKPRQLAAKKLWYEKFRCFYSDGFLVIGGRDATTNDIIIKKHMDKNDIVFHTELAGSPIVLIKNPDNKKFSESIILEAAQFCASYSRSWRSGRGTAEVYHITPEQVSKEAPSGTAGLAKGSFMIYGKRNMMDVALNIAICNFEGKIMSGPISAIKKYCTKHNSQYIEIIFGKDKLSDVAKKIKKIIGGDLDEIIRSLPSECAIKKTR